MMIQDMLSILGVQPHVMNRVRIAVTCLLRDEGGWWSTGAAVSRTARYWMMPDKAGMLVGLALVEMALEGHAATRPSSHGLLYSYVE